MATPNTPAPAPANAAKGPELPNPTGSPAPATGKPPEPPPAPPKGPDGEPTPAPAAKTPANQIEAELMTAYGEDWDKMPAKAKERAIAAEMKSREADKRMQIAAKMKKDLDMTTAQTNQLIEALKRDPWTVLKNPALGHDVRKLAEEYVWNMIQEQRMTPEQREAAQIKLENIQMKAEKEQALKEQSDLEMNAMIDARRKYWEKTIPEAIDAAKLPKTSYTVRRFAEYVKAAAKARVPADMPAIAEQIRQELIDLQSRFLLPGKGANETEDQYEERVLASAPNDFVKMLRKADLRKLRAKGGAPKPGPKPAPAAPLPNNGKVLMSDWIAQRDQRLGRK